MVFVAQAYHLVDRATPSQPDDMLGIPHQTGIDTYIIEVFWLKQTFMEHVRQTYFRFSPEFLILVWHLRIECQVECQRLNAKKSLDKYRSRT